MWGGIMGDVSKCAWRRCLSFNQLHWVALIAIACNYAATHALEKFVKDKVQMLARYLHNKCELFTKDKGLRDTTTSQFIRKIGLSCCFCCGFRLDLKKASFEVKHEQKSYWNKPQALVEIPHAMLHSPRSDENVKRGQWGRERAWDKASVT